MLATKVGTIIPNPLRSGEFTLHGGTYTGDVGSVDSNAPAVLELENRATANVTVTGDNTSGHFATFNVKGQDTLNFNSVCGGYPPPFGGFASVNLDHGATLTTSFHTGLDGFLTFNGETGSKLENFSGTVEGGGVVVKGAAIKGTGDVTIGQSGGQDGAMQIYGAVSKGETITVDAGSVLLGKPMQFEGSFVWDPGEDPLNTSIGFSGLTADSYAYDGREVHLFAGNDDFFDVKISNPNNAPFHVVQTPTSGVSFVETLFPNLPEAGVPLPVHQG